MFSKKLSYLLILLILLLIVSCPKKKEVDHISITSLEFDNTKINDTTLAITWKLENGGLDPDLTMKVEIKDGTTSVGTKTINYKEGDDPYTAEFTGLTTRKIYTISITVNNIVSESSTVSITGFPANPLSGTFTLTPHVDVNKVTWPSSPTIDEKAAGYLIKMEGKDSSGTVVTTKYMVGCLAEYKFSFCDETIDSNSGELSYTSTANDQYGNFVTLYAFNFGNYGKNPVVGGKLAAGLSLSGAVGGSGSGSGDDGVRISRIGISGGSLTFNGLPYEPDFKAQVVGVQMATTGVIASSLDKTTITPAGARTANFLYSIVNPPHGFSINEFGNISVTPDNILTPQSNYLEVRATIDSPLYTGFVKNNLYVGIGNEFHFIKNVSFTPKGGNTYDIIKTANTSTWDGAVSALTLKTGSGFEFKQATSTASFFIGLSASRNQNYSESDMTYSVNFSGSEDFTILADSRNSNFKGNIGNLYSFRITSDGYQFYSGSQLRHSVTLSSIGEVYLYIGILNPRNNAGNAINDFKITY